MYYFLELLRKISLKLKTKLIIQANFEKRSVNVIKVNTFKSLKCGHK